MSLRHMEVQTAATEHTAATMVLKTFLRQMTDDQRRIQLLATRSAQVISVGRATAVADMIAVSDVEITVHRTGIEVDVKAGICSGRNVPRGRQRIVDTRLYRTVVTRRTVFFHHQVDDTRGTFRTEFGAGVGDQFNLLDRSCRHLFEDLSAVLAAQSGRTTVDPYLHVIVAAQGDIAFLIDIDGRDVLQHIGHRGTCRSDVLIDGEHFLV